MPLLVSKFRADYRLTSDLGPVNTFTIKHHVPISNNEHELDSLTMAKAFTNYYMAHSYSQLILDTDSQECQYTISPHGIFTMNRVVPGTTNAVTHLQFLLMAIIPEYFRQNILIRLDDILHAETVAQLPGFIAAFTRLRAD